MVCTAGITENGEWVRLYPIDYRYLPQEAQFKKYQWIEVELQERGASNDKRKESRKPILENIQLLGDPLSTGKNWANRRAIIDKLPHHTLKQYKELYAQDSTSLGVVRPTRVLDMTIEKVTDDWSEKQQGILSQQRLFGQKPKELAKIPYKFSYVFECEDSDKPHKAMCEDWELGALYLNELKRLGSDEAAAESVKNKFLHDLCAPERDTRFFMGTVFPYNTWVILGVFYPPKITGPQQLNLFE
ncbi:MAG: hypothetical protein ACFE0Q_11915 [Anaerolineae bacterium]